MLNFITKTRAAAKLKQALEKEFLFDKAFYLRNNRDVAKSKLSAYNHFMRFGWRERRNPSLNFSTSSYLRKNNDVLNSGMNPLTHYLEYGKKEGRAGNNAPFIKEEIILIGHSARVGGAERVLLNIIRELKKSYAIKLILLSPGKWISLFEEECETLLLGDSNSDNESLISEFIINKDAPVIFNTIVSLKIYSCLNKHRGKKFCYIHERAPTLALFPKEQEILKKEQIETIVAGDAVADDLKRIVNKNTICLEPFIDAPAQKTEAEIENFKKTATGDIACLIVLACGVLAKHKRPDIFIEVAHELQKADTPQLKFVWLGDGPLFEECVAKTKRLSLENTVTFAGFADSDLVKEWMSAADVFLLPSEEDSFPLVCLEAMAAGLPVIYFKDAGGIHKAIGNTAGTGLSDFSSSEMAGALKNLLQDSELRKKLGASGRSIYATRFTVQCGAASVKKIIEPAMLRRIPLVSVIVPNYNHAPYLRERLDTIYKQTYRNFEVILLDDNSTDESLQILEEYQERYPQNTRIIANKINTKNVFRQWMRGLDAAVGELIWIAESDDVAELSFLDEMVSIFAKFDDCNLSYCQSRVIDETGRVHAENYLSYTSEFSQTKWLLDYCTPGKQELCEALAIKNTIPNASAVLFKKRAALNCDFSKMLEFTLAGDWMFYVMMAEQSGTVAYSKEVLNSHRRHSKSVITANRNWDNYLREIASIHRYVIDRTSPGKQTVDRMKSHLAKERLSLLGNELTPLELSIYKIEVDAVLIVISELNYGGGEILPIRLANALSERGINTVLYNVANKPSDKDILSMISEKVTIYSAEAPLELENSLELICRRHRIKVINTFVWWADKFIAKQIATLNLPWVVSLCGCHEFLLENKFDKEFDDVMAKISAFTSAFVYQAEKNKAAFTEFPTTAPLFKIDTGYSAKPPRPVCRASLNISESAKIMGFVARGIPEKGWNRAIQLCDLLRNSGRDVHLILLGDSEYVAQLKKENSLKTYIHFLGNQSDLSQYIPVFDLALLPTFFKSESMPTVIVEFLAYGVPVVATNVGSIKQMLSTEIGVAGGIVSLDAEGEADSAELFAHASKLLFEDSAFRLAVECAKKAFSRYSMESFLENYLYVYKTAVERQNS